MENPILGGGYTCSECGQYQRTSAVCDHFNLIDISVKHNLNMKTKEEIENICGNIIDSESINDQHKQSVYEGCVLGYTKYHEDNNTSKVTRVEVVDETGRVYSKWNCKVELSYQDDGRTLKVFVK